MKLTLGGNGIGSLESRNRGQEQNIYLYLWYAIKYDLILLKVIFEVEIMILNITHKFIIIGLTCKLLTT